MKKPLRVLCATLVIILGLVCAYETTQPIPEECSRQDWQAVYFGWDDNAGPCTYLQRVSFDLLVLIVYPLGILWPMTLIGVIIGSMYLASLLFRSRLPRPDLPSAFTYAISGLLVVWFLFVVFMQVADTW